MVDEIVRAKSPPATGDGKKTASQKIFEAARELFYQRGVRAVGVDEIVSAAGVTKPSLYRAFRSKEELVVACLEQRFDEGREALHDAMAKAADDPLDKLRALIGYFAAKVECPEFRGCAISNFAVELPEVDHPGRAVLVRCKTELRGIIVDLARQLRIVDADDLADGLMLIMEGAISSHHIFGYDRPTRSMVMTCEALIAYHMQQVREPA